MKTRIKQLIGMMFTIAMVFFIIPAIQVKADNIGISEVTIKINAVPEDKKSAAFDNSSWSISTTGALQATSNADSIMNRWYLLDSSYTSSDEPIKK